MQLVNWRLTDLARGRVSGNNVRPSRLLSNPAAPPGMCPSVLGNVRPRADLTRWRSRLQLHLLHEGENCTESKYGNYWKQRNSQKHLEYGEKVLTLLYVFFFFNMYPFGGVQQKCLGKTFCVESSDLTCWVTWRIHCSENGVFWLDGGEESNPREK